MTPAERYQRVRVLESYTAAVRAHRAAERDLQAAREALDDFIALAGRRKRTPPPCGTEGGYYRHIRGTKTVPKSLPCEPCLYAHAAAERNRLINRAGAKWRAGGSDVGACDDAGVDDHRHERRAG